jgi:excisionase family DNA binding protein
VRETHSEWLGLSQTAHLLGVHPSTVRTWADKGELPVHRTPGGHRRFRRSDVEVWAAARRISHPGEAQVVVQNAIGRIRIEVGDGRLRQQGWYQKLTEAQRAQYREGSNRLLRELIRYVSVEGENGEAEARSLGRDYARMGKHADMALREAVEAFLFFHELLLESVFHVYEAAGVHSASAWGGMRKRVSGFTNRVLLALIDAYAHKPG